MLPYNFNLDDPNLSLELLLEELLRRFFNEMKQAKNHLLLDMTEMLATILVMLWDVDQAEAYLIAAGDGCWAINDEIVYLEQGNRPDYPVYHVGKSFEAWYERLNKQLIKKPKRLSIATDGLHSYIGKNGFKPLAGEVERYMLLSKAFMEDENMLKRKAAYLHKQKAWSPLDDVAIVSFY